LPVIKTTLPLLSADGSDIIPTSPTLSAFVSKRGSARVDFGELNSVSVSSMVGNLVFCVSDLIAI